MLVGKGGEKQEGPVFAESLTHFPLSCSFCDVVTLAHSCCGSAVAVLWGTEPGPGLREMREMRHIHKSSFSWYLVIIL